MSTRWVRPAISATIVLAIAGILFLNREPGAAPTPVDVPATPPGVAAGISSAAPIPAGGIREYPIGDDVTRDHLRIAAVWLPSVQMDGSPATAGMDVIHLEADVRSTEGNPNGFAKDEFVPYLKIRYELAPAAGGAALQSGEMSPMVARDGLHYGASIAMPAAGQYKLTYRVSPPSAGGLGRHSDPLGGVAPWWPPFDVSFDWDHDGPPAAASPAADRSAAR